MAIELATGYVSLVPSTKGFSSRLKSELKGVGTTAGAQVGGEFNDGMGSKVSGLLRGIGVAAAKTGAVIGVAGAALGTWGLKNAADMQQTQIAFEGIFGSASSANAFLGELKSFAARTPFEFPELANASKQLLAVGFSAEEVIPSMTKIGNVAATLGVGGEGINSVVRALGQMKGKGKASAEELQQISEAIPGFSAIGAIADSMGISTSQAFDLMAKGAIPADQAIQAILAGMDKFPGAAGAMERQSKTLAGVLSTLKDTVSQALVGGIGPALPALADSINQAMPSIGTAIGSFGSTFGKVLVAVTPLLDTLLPIITKVADVLAGVFGEAVKALVPVFQKLAPHIGKIVEVLGGAFTKVITAIAPSLPKFAAAIGKIAEVMGGAFADVIVAIAPPLGRIATILGGALAKAATLLAPIISKVGAVLAGSLSKVLIALEPSLPGIADAIGQMAVAFGDILVAVAPLIPPLTSLAVLLITKIGVPQLVAIAQAFALMATSIATLVGWVSTAIGSVGQLGDVFSTVGGAIKDAFTGAMSWVGDRISDIIGFIASIPGRVASFVGTIWDGFKTATSDAIAAVVGFFEGIPGALAGLAASFFTAASDLGGKILGGIIDGISGAIGKVVDIGKAIANGIANFVNKHIIDKVNALEFEFPTSPWTSQTVGMPFDIPHIPTFKMHRGGVVPGRTGTEVPALLQAGEQVLSIKQVRAIKAIAPGLAATGTDGMTVGPIYITEASRPLEVASSVATILDWKLTGRADG